MAEKEIVYFPMVASPHTDDKNIIIPLSCWLAVRSLPNDCRIFDGGRVDIIFPFPSNACCQGAHVSHEG